MSARIVWEPANRMAAKLSCCLRLNSTVKLLTTNEYEGFQSSIVRVTRKSEMVTIDFAVALQIN
jgi:c-di-GMP-binding flagellar brake protein YcgR